MPESTLPSPPQFEAILSSAVDRQVNEQRSLQNTLADLHSGMGEVRDAVNAAAADVRGLAEAVHELKDALKEHYEGLEGRVASLATSVLEGLRELAGTQQTALESLAKAVSASTGTIGKEVSTLLRDGIGMLGRRVDGLADRISESTEISQYLRDQADDLDTLLKALGEVPTKLEAVIAQALRRGLTVRAGLMQEAEKALEQALGPVEERVRQLAQELGVARRSARGRGEDRQADGRGRSLSEEMRRLTLRQVELATRIDDLHTSFRDALQSMAAAQPAAAREGLEAGERPKPEPRRPRRPRAPGGRLPAGREKGEAEPTKARAKKATPAASGGRAAKASPTEEAKPAPGRGKRTAARPQAEPVAATTKKRVPQPSRRRRNYIPV